MSRSDAIATIETYFDQLPGTRKEVGKIAEMFPGKKVRALYDKEATESAVKTEDLQNYRYIHLATHGILGGEVPGIGEPALVFAGESGEDGLLLASEAEKLKLKADMTILSACKTGSGHYVTGEGVLGMGRSFLLAGSSSVVVSLWSVADEETAALMVALYRHRQAGKSPADALRLAALEVRTSNPHPFYWAAFIVIGESELGASVDKSNLN